MPKIQRSIIAFFSSCFLIVTTAIATPAAQAPSPGTAANGSISGSVTGDHGPIQGATVSISGAAARSQTTSADGLYEFTGLPDGTYELTARAPGYTPLRPASVTISAGGAQIVNVQLNAPSLQTLRTIASTTSVGRGTVTINTSGAAISTLTSQDFLERGETQVEDMLEELPGVELTRAGGAPGSNTDLAIRGATPYETQTLIDGHPVIGGRYGEFLVQFLDPLVIGSIQIDKGPGVMGNTIANAVGGTANFVTPQITSRLVGQLQTGYDSFNGSTYSARVSDTIGKFGFLAAYGFGGTPGYFVGNIPSVTSASESFPGSAPPLATINTLIPATEAFQNRSQVFKLAYNFSPTTTLTLGEINEQTYVDYTAALASVEPYTIVAACGACGSYTNPAFGGYVGHTILAASYNEGDDLYLGNYELDNEPIFTGDLRTSLGPGSFLGRYYTGAISRDIDDPEEAQQIKDCTNPTCNPPTLDSPFYQSEVDRLHGADFQYSVPFGRDAQDLVTVSYDQHVDESLYCYGGTALFTASDCPVNNLIERSQTFSARAFADVLPKLRLGFGNYFSDTSFVGSRYDPRATLVWTPQRQTAVRFAVGTTYVAPPSLFVAPVAGANKAVVNGTLDVDAALKPETSAGVDLGADFGIHGDSKFTVDLYRTALTDRFSTATIKPKYALPSGTSFGTYDGMPFDEIKEVYNASDAIEQGVEFGYIRAPRVGIQGTASFDLLQAYNYNIAVAALPAGLGASQTAPDTIGGDATELAGFQIPGYPYSHGRVSIGYKWPSSALVSVGSTIYGANNSFGEPGFSVFDAHADLPLNYGLRAVVSARNIFNHDDGRALEEYGYGYQPPGESVPYPLLFAPPRQVTFQLVYPFGGR